jgi:predicted phage tail protein
MKTIYFHGALKQFGESYQMDAENPAMALRGLILQIKGLMQFIREGSFIVIRGKEETGISLDETELSLSFGREDELHLIPYIAGSGGGKGGSIAKAITGYILIAVGVALAPYTGGLSLGLSCFGLQMTITGVSQLMTAKPKATYNRGPVDQRPSFLFNGAINSSQQGVPIPLVYGRMRVGSVVISGGVSVEATVT